MNQIIKYINYFNSYFSNGDFQSIIDSINYLIFKKGARNNRIASSYLGRMKIRKSTNDFLYINYYYEWSVKSYISSIYHNYNVFLDMGAGIGDYSIFLAKKGLQCIAFEPVKDNYTSLLENIKINQLEKSIQAIQTGLGSSEMETEFIVKKVNTGASHRANLSVNKHIKDNYKETVNINSFDNLYLAFSFTKQDSILIKMDMEGMEMDGLIGAREFIKKFPNITIIAEAKHCGNNEIINMLNTIANFEIGRIDNENIYARKLSNHQ